MAFGSESAGLFKMAKKIDFMKKILRAEADSQSTDRSKHISCIADKLSALEITFLEWVESSAGHGVIDHPETSSPAFSDTESYAVEQMDVASDRKDAEDENRWVKEQEQEVRADGEGEVEEDEKKEQCVSSMVSSSKAMGFVAAILVVVAMVCSKIASFTTEEETTFLVPT
ncbi:hypothetical protein OPV22_022117 [Ensete ventricosum]|uniref:DUF7610 domain-containing protein n=1 Tax=Ensete ventricosum TaxID=4639 RepID=A0AAV8QRV0_ENSVE|nr:hypothetical protein OPV22_022117 [Ensete ventricosum]